MGLEPGLLRLELRLAVGVRLLRGVRSLARLLELARVDLRRGSRLCRSWLCGPRLAVSGLAVSGLRGSWLRGSRLAIARLNRPALLPLSGLLPRILASARVAPPVRHRVVLRDVVLSDAAAGPWLLMSLRFGARPHSARTVAVSQRSAGNHC